MPIVHTMLLLTWNVMDKDTTQNWFLYNVQRLCGGPLGLRKLLRKHNRTLNEFLHDLSRVADEHGEWYIGERVLSDEFKIWAHDAIGLEEGE